MDRDITHQNIVMEIIEQISNYKGIELHRPFTITAAEVVQGIYIGDSYKLSYNGLTRIPPGDEKPYKVAGGLEWLTFSDFEFQYVKFEPQPGEKYFSGDICPEVVKEFIWEDSIEDNQRLKMFGCYCTDEQALAALKKDHEELFL